MQNTQIVILAAGKGRRMGRQDLPKVLVPLKGKPVICHLLDEMKKLKDLSEPIIVVGYRSVRVKEILGKGYRYALQREQLGTAHAVWSARSCINAGNVLVLYGDMPFIKASSLKKLLHLHASQKSVISMFTSHVPNFEGYYGNFRNFGRIIRNQFSDITKIQEAPDASEEQKRIREINSGIYLFDTEWLWGNIADINNKNALEEFYLTDIVEIAMQQGHPINSLNIDPKEIFGINTAQQLQQAAALIRQT